MKLNYIPNKQLFKWIGGKKWLSNTLQEYSTLLLNKNTNLDTYIEPFVGGLGSFLSILPILEEYQTKKQTNITIVINDLNNIIIESYKNIKDNLGLVIEKYLALESVYLSKVPEQAYKVHKTKQKDELKILLKECELYFNEIKRNFNQTKKQIDNIDNTAYFLFLMEHSFNSVYRENLKGEFNTPFNWDNKTISLEAKKENIISYHNLFNHFNIVFESCDVFELLEKYKEHKSFIYLDPPYMNDNQANENKYNENHFTKQKQIALIDLLCNDLSKNNANEFLYSNHLLPIISDKFKEYGMDYIEVYRKNIMTSKKEDRGNEITEILAFSVETTK